MQAVRDYGQGSQSPTAKLANAQAAARFDQLYDLEGPYQAHIRSALAQEDFSRLDAEAEEARLSQSRLNSGLFRLFTFYRSIHGPAGGVLATDSDWQDHFAAVRKWIAARPQSATARIVLADTYVNYAWKARRNGYANTVSGSGWKRFNERIELGKAALMDAAKSKEKCPYWYEVMQQIALAQGWDKQQARELFDQATAFAPRFYHFYREYANFLLPKWYGEEGETQAFAEEASSRLPDPDGSILYFEIASLVACQCDKARDSLEGMSWPRVKRGYQDLERLYGTSKLKANRFAYMSYVAEDKDAAQEPFSRLGDDWEETVWHSAADYQVAKKWAFSQ